MSWVASAVAAERPWMEDLLVDLVSVPTTVGNEEAGQARMARAFTECGLEPVDVWMDASAIRADPHHSPFSWDVAGKRNLTATWAGSGGGRSLILNGHIDVVPAPKYGARRDGDWLYGRGAGDMKAGLVAMTGAVRALRAAGVELDGSVQLQSVVEEECTGNGTLQCLIDGAHADAAVLTEPHPDSFTIAQVGVLWFHVDVTGVTGHAGYGGTSPIASIGAVLAELRVLEAELNAERHGHYADHPHPIYLNPGVISGGDWPSSVPASCTLSCRLATYPGTDPAALRARLEAAVARPGVGAEVRYDGFSCEGSVVPEDAPVVLALADAYRQVLGAEPSLEATTATTDARHFVRAGIPAICFGPRAEDIHGHDERVSLRSVLEVATVLAHFVLDWCGLKATRGEAVHVHH